jgi:hypothetical protein
MENRKCGGTTTDRNDDNERNNNINDFTVPQHPRCACIYKEVRPSTHYPFPMASLCQLSRILVGTFNDPATRFLGRLGGAS